MEGSLEDSQAGCESVQDDWSDAFPPEVRKSLVDGVEETRPGDERVQRLYEHGKMLARKRREAAGRTAEQQGCTFKPEINPNTKKINEKIAEEQGKTDRFELLYKTGKDQQSKLEQNRKAAQEAEKPSFAPSINKASEKKATPDGQTRFNVLYTNALQQQEKLRRRRETFQEEECTFEPKLNKATPAASSASRKTASTGIERLNELYKHAQLVEEKRRKQHEDRVKELTFRPQINPASAQKPSRKSIAALCPDPEIVKQRQAKLQEMRLAREMQGCTFTPQVNPETPPSAPGTASGSTGCCSESQSLSSSAKQAVHLRLYEEARNRVAKQRQQEMQLYYGSSSEVSSPSQQQPHSPASTRSGKSAGKATSAAEAARTFARLYADGKEATQRKVREEREAEERRANQEWEENREECTFSPSIHESSRKIIADRRSAERKGVDIFSRLHAESVAKNLKRDIDADDRLGMDLACTFSPEISEQSRKLVEKRLEERRRHFDEVRSYRFLRKAPGVQNELLPSEEELKGVWNGTDSAKFVGRDSVISSNQSELDHQEELLQAALESRLEAPTGHGDLLNQAVQADALDAEDQKRRQDSWQ